MGAGQKIDTTLTLVRIGFFFGDNTLVTENLTKAEQYVSHPPSTFSSFPCLFAYVPPGSLTRAATGIDGIDSKSTKACMRSLSGNLRGEPSCFWMH